MKETKPLAGDELVQKAAEWIKHKQASGVTAGKIREMINLVSDYAAFVGKRASTAEVLSAYISVVSGRNTPKVAAMVRMFVRAVHRWAGPKYDQSVMEVPPLRIPTTFKRETFSHTEWEQIKAGIPKLFLNPCIVGYHTGLRFKDVCLLRWDQISMQDMLIVVVPEKTLRKGTTATIPIVKDSELHVALVEMLKYAGSEYVFAEMAARYTRTKNSGMKLATKMQKAIKKCGCKGKGFHTFRRTFITRLMSSGASAQVAKNIAGLSHSSTLEHYAVATTESLRNAVAQTLAQDEKDKAAAAIQRAK